jgi:hypothetical protein
MPHPLKKPIRKRQLTAAEFAARYRAERIVQQRRYCELFEQWRRCRSGRCHREQACMGDASACLKRAFAAVPHAAQWQARQEFLAAMPKNIGAPERAARQCMPVDLYVENSAQAVGEYLARFDQKRPPQRR